MHSAQDSYRAYCAEFIAGFKIRNPTAKLDASFQPANRDFTLKSSLGPRVRSLRTALSFVILPRNESLACVVQPTLFSDHIIESALKYLR